MTQFDITRIQSSSLTPGITSLGEPLTFTKTFSGTIPISGSLTTTIPLTFGRSNVMSLTKVNVAGGNVGSYWFPVPGFAGIVDYTNLGAVTGGYYMLFTITSTSSGRTMNVEFINETVGATVVLPTLTITVEVSLFDYPF